MTKFTESDLEKKGYIRQDDGNYHPKHSATSLIVKKGVYNETTLGLHGKPYQESSVTPKCFKEAMWAVNNDISIAPHAKLIAAFNITPIGKPRMTQSDKWKSDPNHKDPNKQQRKAVTQYFRFKDEILSQAAKQGFKMPESHFHVFFIMPMPHSWNSKKRSLMMSNPHQQKPDVDNMIKAVKDSLCESDAHVWDYRITKKWGNAGQILIYSLNE